MRNQRGQSLVELAIVLPILLLLLLGIVEFGRVYSVQLMLDNASREGVRLGVVGASDEQIVAKVREIIMGVDDELYVVIITPTVKRSGDPLTVEIRYDHSFFVPLFSSLSSEGITLTARSTMRVE